MPRWLFGLFFASGVTGLLYETIWSRYVRLLLGSAATAQVVVLGLFMGGLSVGAMAIARKSASVRRPFVAYGIVEAIIGVYALAFPWLFEAVTRLGYDLLLPAIGGGFAIEVVKWGLAAALVFPPCVLLGATFPLMSVGMIRAVPGESGRLLALLYFWNSLGAALGALVTGFVMVSALGLPGTLAVGGVINIGIGMLATRERSAFAPLGSRQREPATDASEARAKPSAGSNLRQQKGPKPTPEAAMTGWPVWVALASGTGLASFIYEVSWMRLLATILGSATHSFEVMLSAFVLGIALGGLWIRRRIDTLRRPGLTLAGVQLVMGMMAIATLPLYRVATAGIAAVFYQDERTTTMWIAFNVMRYLVCLALMLPATFCAGMTLPLLTHWLLSQGASERVIGRVYGINTLGAIAGAVLAGMLLLPGLGLVRTIVMGAAVDMGLGLFLLWWLGGPTAAVAKLRWRAAAGVVVTLGLGFWRLQVDPHVLAAGVFRRGTTELHPRFETVSHVDGRTASITVMRDGDDPSYHVIYTNGKPDASIRTQRWPDGRDHDDGPTLALDEPTQILVGALPLLAHPTAKRAALIGLGSGVTCNTLLASPVLESLDTVEIEPEMAHAARGLGPNNHRAFHDPRSRLYFDDAKAHFAGVGGAYDILVSQPSNPWVSGVSSLFTVEFYAEIRRYLAPGGVLAQWVQGYELSDDLLYAMLAAVEHEFADYRVYRVGSRDWLILARVDGTMGALSSVPAEWPDLRHDLGLLGIHDVRQLDALLAANRRMLLPTLADVRPNRDAWPILDTGAERSRFMRDSAESLLALRLLPLPLRAVFGGIDTRGYPEVGILDARERKHVLAEPEKARALMAAHGRDDLERLPGTSEMQVFLSHHRQFVAVPTDAAVAQAWFVAAYEVYNYVAPWIDLRGSRFWAEVRAAAARRGVPRPVARAISLLDAVVERDGSALLQRAEIELGAEDSRLDPRFSALAGALGLELMGLDTAMRERFVHAHMDRLGTGATSDDAAFRLVRSMLQHGGK